VRPFFYGWGVMKREFGQRGEGYAADYLKAKGYIVVEVNWRCSKGELDIIAREKETLVFVEVRSRHSATTESAFESITPRKREKLIRTAHLYLEAHGLSDQVWRIDAVAVALPAKGKAIIDHVENALDW